MIDCVIIGDTIAQNLQNSIKCAEERVSSNITSSRVINIAGGAPHQVCIISAGSFDYPFSYKTYDNLKEIRDKTLCKVYVWIRPLSSKSAAVDVDTISSYNDDIEVNLGKSTDNITPDSYKDLSADIINKLNAKGL